MLGFAQAQPDFTAAPWLFNIHSLSTGGCAAE